MIELSEFISRRHALLAAMQTNSICVIPAAHLTTRSRDTEYSFRQDSYFHYLSGFPEPQAWLVLSNQLKQQPKSDGLSILFCLDKDPAAEIWHGRRFGPQAAKKKFGFGMAFSLDELDEKLAELVDGHQNLYFAQGHSPEADAQMFGLLEELRAAPKQSKTAPGNIVDVRPILDEMRLFKSPAEADLMRTAAEISCAAHIRAMKFAQAGRFEYQLQAEIHHEFAMQGAKDPAYGTIVGSGHNGCILHYTENSDELKSGDLVLIDAGCELQGYAADITRTFPISGQYTPAQKQLYQLVLDSQLAAFELIKPGSTIKIASDKAIAVITEGLINLGILQGELADNITQQHYREFFMHGLSHWLGLDVHDVGNYKIDGIERPFEPGMVLTVEPGIYIAPDAKVDKRWRGIGIRIEDNLLITKTGHENLTAAAPKHIAAIETLMNTPPTKSGKQLMQSYDVVIVGGGMVGLTLALALKDCNISVAVIDAELGDKPLSTQPELRVSALSVASENILRNLGVWPALDDKRMLAYENMQVWDKDSFGKIEFSCEQVEQSHLGYIIENQSVRRSLWQEITKHKNIELLAPNKITKLVFGQQESFITLDNDSMLSARLVVGADGANSYVRQQAALPLTFWDYEHQAIVATVKTEFPHRNNARQIFTPSGPLAFLPLWEAHICSIVWSQQVPKAEHLMALSDEEFNKTLTASFDGCLGLCTLQSERRSFPLKMRYARQWLKDRVVLVGDAAHTIHPLAGQGANLGLLDAAALAEQIIKLSEHNKDIGLAKNLRPYERWRKTEAVKMIASMEAFKQLFGGSNPLKKMLRDIGLSSIDHLPGAKQKFIQQAMGLGGELPKLARAIKDVE